MYKEPQSDRPQTFGTSPRVIRPSCTRCEGLILSNLDPSIPHVLEHTHSLIVRLPRPLYLPTDFMYLVSRPIRHSGLHNQNHKTLTSNSRPQILMFSTSDPQAPKIIYSVSYTCVQILTISGP